MLDTEGSEVHISAVAKPMRAEEGDEFTFTVRKPPYPDGVFGVSYDAFIYDVEVGDEVVVDGGMVRLEVQQIAGPDVLCRCVDPGLILSRANLTFRRQGKLVRGQNARLSVITAKDWEHIDFGVEEGVDFIAISFVKSADVISNLKSYIQRRTGSHSIEIVAKIESIGSMPNLHEIAQAADVLMVARGDLGAQIDIEEVPSVQKDVVVKGRKLGKPVIVASHLLQSMIEHPIPTRAEVADIADCVRQQADALMLCGESAVGAYPGKSIDVLKSVATQVEEWSRQEKFGVVSLPQIATSDDGRVSEELCAGAVSTANKLKARAIFVYTRRGHMANYLSRLRPDCPIFAFTDSSSVRRRMNLRWGVMPFRMSFGAHPDDNIMRAFKFLKMRKLVSGGDLVVVVSDIRPAEGDVVRSVQIRHVR
ncbi:unnamed protein product [Ostreobium quekettii]|uniref:Pyruvate kinase n=1 Tax=Ostreobium quekettii TaxID=121088 RepID=A0A8S1ITT1_9CHLO|nr:unnamed protein product [Ostreobium quekettii]